MTRVPLHAVLTRREAQVAELIGRGFKLAQVAEGLGIGAVTARDYMYGVSSKIPGDLPARARIIVWWRGASLDILAAPHS